MLFRRKEEISTLLWFIKSLPAYSLKFRHPFRFEGTKLIATLVNWIILISRYAKHPQSLITISGKNDAILKEKIANEKFVQ